MSSNTLLNANYLSHALKEAFPHTSFLLDVFPTIHSTNRYLLKKETKNLHICLAEEQTAGRGRPGKTWISPFGMNLYCSVFFPFNRNILEAPNLTLCIGTIVAKTLEEYGVPEVTLKWPNDVLAKQKKIAGILVETLKEGKNHYKAVIGIGINVFLSDALNAQNMIEQPWTDIKSVVNFLPDRNKLAYTLLKNLLRALPIFEQHGFSTFKKVWFEKDILLNQFITIKTDKTIFNGISKGINEKGELLLDIYGKINAFSSAEVELTRRIMS